MTYVDPSDSAADPNEDDGWPWPLRPGRWKFVPTVPCGGVNCGVVVGGVVEVSLDQYLT